jgi:copper homeostasis protein CutC
MTSFKNKLAACAGLAITGLTAAFGMVATADAAPATPAASIVSIQGTTASASFNHAAPANEWMNQCIEQVPQSNWGTVIQTNTDNGQAIDTGILCNPYALPPPIPAPN